VLNYSFEEGGFPFLARANRSDDVEHTGGLECGVLFMDCTKEKKKELMKGFNNPLLNNWI
jgi:hypothetical protein